MSLTKLQPNSVNTTATFTFANINVTDTANLGDVLNVVITGGSSGQYLQTDGAGNLAWAGGGGGGGGGSPGGIDTYVQFNDGGNFGGVGAFTFNKSTNSLVVGGNVTSNNSNLGNLATANYFSGNGSLLTGITVSTAGTVTTNAQPNITSVGSLSGLTISNVSGIVNFTTTANVTLGAVSNLHISGGTSGYVLSTDGSSGLSWVAQSGGGGSYGNSNVADYLPVYTGNVNANYFIGNGSTLTYVTGGNVSGNVTSAVQSHYANTANSVVGSNVSGQVGNALVAGTVYTNAQPNITSVGTLASLSVAANITSGNASLGNLATATYFSGNGIFISNIAGANVSGIVANATYATSAGTAGSATTAGTVTTNAQPNITSLGILAGLTGTDVINLTGTSNVALGAVGNVHITGGTSGYVLSTDGSGTLSWVAQSGGGSGSPGGSNTQIQFNDNGSFGGNSAFTFDKTTGNVVITGNLITGSGTGGNISGLNYVIANYFSGNGSLLTYVTGGNINGNVTSAIQSHYANIANSVTGSNVSGNVTSAIQSHYANIANSVAGSNVSGQVGNALVAGTVYTNAQPNITSVGTLVSLSVSGDATVTGNFTVSGNTTYINVETFRVEDPIIELGGGVNGAALISNDGKDRGSILHYYTTGVVDAFMGWDNSNGEFAFGSNVSVSSEVVTFNSFGNIRANNFLGTSTTAGSATTAGTVTTNAQPNITSVGTLSGLTVTGNITSGNASLGNLATASYFSGNGIFISNIAGANVSGTVANATYATSAGSATTAGTVTTNAQPNITSIGTLSSLTVTANISSGNANLGNLATASYFTGNGSLLTYITGSNVIGNVTSAVQSHYANIANSVAGSNVSGQVGNALVAGTVYTNAQPNITSVGTLSSLSVTGNITSGNIDSGNSAIANYFTGNGIYISNISGANVSGTVANATYATSAGSATSATTAGTVTTNAQPNITSVGTIAGLTGTGVFDLTGTSNVALGAVGNVHISGGTAGYVLSTDGSGALSWVAQSGGGGGSYGNSNVADYLPTYTGNVSANYFIGNGSVLTGQVGNALIAGTVYTNAQPNITSVGSLNSLTVTGLITATGTGLKAANVQDSSGTITITTKYNSVSGDVGIYGNLNVGTSGTGFFIGDGGYISNITASNITGQVSNALIAGTVYTNAQPNITSVGSLSGLTVSNATGVVNFTTTANVTLGSVSNLHISGGSANYVLQTDGSGTLSWAAGGGGGSPTIADDTTTNATYYPVYATASSGSLSTAGVSSTKLQFNPSLGQLTVTDLNSLSDATLKTNWQIIDDPFSILDQLFGMGFEWTDNGRKSYGLSAQNVESILPELVGTTAQGKKTVNYIPIIAFLLEALKKNNKELQEIRNSIKPKRQSTKKDK